MRLFFFSFFFSAAGGGAPLRRFLRFCSAAYIIAWNVGKKPNAFVGHHLSCLET
jgi:hypothetical protein